MKIVSINSVNFGSTGNIMLEIAKNARKRGHKCYTCCPKSRENGRKQAEDQIFIGNRVFRNIHIKIAKYTGLHGCFSIIDTLMFIKKIKKINPNLIHLHNLHSDYINIPILFNFLKKSKIKTVWTLHDCWAFTGHCPHFTLAKCEKWKTGCFNCPCYFDYPESKIDDTKFMWRLKRKWFTSLEDLTLVTPSKWLSDLVAQSFLKDFPVKVINNGIDLSIFKPTESDFRKKYNCEGKYILLGVAFDWGKRKGLDVFCELANRLDSEKYQIVLVGTNDYIDNLLPDNIVSIHRTQNQTELAEIYTAADLFVNPTREEVFGLVNVEALACGIPVITFKTGGSPECVDETCGSIIDYDDIECLVKEINIIKECRPYNSEECINRADLFKNSVVYQQYIDLYEGLL